MIVRWHPREYGEHYLLADRVDTEGWWTFKAESVFLIIKGACTVVEDIALHLEREFGHVPKSVANAFVDVWKQHLVIRVVLCS